MMTDMKQLSPYFPYNGKFYFKCTNKRNLNNLFTSCCSTSFGSNIIDIIEYSSTIDIRIYSIYKFEFMYEFINNARSNQIYITNARVCLNNIFEFRSDKIFVLEMELIISMLKLLKSPWVMFYGNVHQKITVEVMRFVHRNNHSFIYLDVSSFNLYYRFVTVQYYVDMSIIKYATNLAQNLTSNVRFSFSICMIIIIVLMYQIDIFESFWLSEILSRSTAFSLWIFYSNIFLGYFRCYIHNQRWLYCWRTWK